MQEALKRKGCCNEWLMFILLNLFNKLIIQENGYFTILFTVLHQDNTTLRPKIYTNEPPTLRIFIFLRTALLTTAA
jgi:hypothetical protein